MSFLERLHAAARANDSWLCVGLDPDPSMLPTGLSLDMFLDGVVEATQDLVCCFKPNLAFFEALGMEGQQAVRSLLRRIPSSIPVLIDAKRGDTPHSMSAYARAIFEDLHADAVTVSPYLGADSLAPFLQYADRGVFLLCKTSNPGAGEIQDLMVGAEPLYLHIARRALAWDRHGTVGLVVGATYPGDVAAVRQIAPDTPILLPGVGAQAGDLEAAVRSAADSNGERVIVNASRSVLYASRAADWQNTAHQAADALRHQINGARANLSATRAL
ncbi:MAG: orotidine-5'-phosphate decarboxylase [Chloroflexi bacterium]|nr:orotidine-5'-phosphate decarboxylase [Chloroflexota bacterium]